jgi:2-iminobutanoate/2-iminopropanoate deaminase
VGGLQVGALHDADVPNWRVAEWGVSSANLVIRVDAGIAHPIDDGDVMAVSFSLTLPRFAGLAAMAVGAAVAVASPASAQVTKIESSPKGMILAAAKVAPGTEMLFLSGQLASPIDPAKAGQPNLTIEDFGDTKTQTISVMNKIKALLEAQGYTMADVIKMTLFVAADPKLGKLDFMGANAGFKQFFGTPENPGTVARSTFQVAALVQPQFLIEIEATAAKKVAK